MFVLAGFFSDMTLGLSVSVLISWIESHSVWVMLLTVFSGGTITLGSYKRSFGYTDADEDTTARISSLTVGLQQCGSFVGCFLIFPMASRFGRRVSMQISALVFVIGAVIQTGNTHQLASFYVGRVIAGLGVGGASVLVPLYSSEMSPKELRGRIGSGYQFLFTWGIFCSYW